LLQILALFAFTAIYYLPPSIMSTYQASSETSSFSHPQLQLSPSHTYYARKLLYQNLDRLKSVVAAGAGLKADSQSDLNAVLNSLYPDSQEIQIVVEQLERLLMVHQSLSSQKTRHSQELYKTEQQIFWLLGFKLCHPTHQGTILVVDDTLLNLRLLSKVLSHQGYEVHTAENGLSAIASVQSLNPDLILLDIMMPDIDGYEVCERLKANPLTCDTPVVFISTIDQVFDKVKAFGVGAADYLTKPFQPEEILARVAHQLSFRNLQKRLEEQNLRLQKEVQEHKQTEAKYRSIFENSPNGIFQTAPDGRYLNANLALANLYGYSSPDELIDAINNIAQQLYVLPQRRNEFLEAMQQHELLLDFESQIQCKDGSVIWISEDVRKVYDEENRLLCYEGMVRNITARK
jgi:PAS domain S-box-containing protein